MVKETKGSGEKVTIVTTIGHVQSRSEVFTIVIFPYTVCHHGAEVQVNVDSPRR
jgi:hypothetical protein